MEAAGAVPVSEFDRAIEVVARDDDSSLYHAELEVGWLIGGGINGGLLTALAGNALRSELGADGGHTDPFAVSCHYVSATRPGPVEIRTTTARRGGSVSTGSATLTQLGKDGMPVERLRVLASFGDLDAAKGEVKTVATPPELPPLDECVSTDAAPADFLGESHMLKRLDMRLDPACVGWASGKPSGRGLMQGWLRLADGREPDPLMLLMAVDVLPPVTFDLGLYGWTPTVAISAHVRARPVPGWLRLVQSTRNLAGGMLEEDSEVWDASGRLVAQARQLALAPRQA